MFKIVFILVFGSIISSFLSYWSATVKLQDGRRKSWLKKLTKNGWIYWILALVSIFISIGQYLVIDNVTAKEQDRRDSVMTAKYENSIEKMKLSYDISSMQIRSEADSNNLQIIRVLAENNLEYNVHTNKVEKLVQDVGIKPPSLILSEENGSTGIKVEKNIIRWSVTSKNASATNINLKVSILQANEFDLTKYKEMEYFGTKLLVRDLTVTEGYFYNAFITSDHPFNNYNYLFLWFNGSYQNMDKTKFFVFDVVYSYSFLEEDKGIGIVSDERKDEIKLLLKNSQKVHGN